MDGGGGVGVLNISEVLFVCMFFFVYFKDCYKLYFIILVVIVVIEKFL